MRLSVVIPVYDEVATAAELIRRVLALPAPPAQIVVVDDGSTDGTAAALRPFAERGVIELVTHPRNRGKGAAVRTGLSLVRGDVVVIQDADLEYDPADYPALLAPILRGEAPVVYGSRFLGRAGPMSFWHHAGNRLLTGLCNLLFRSTLTDMETGAKCFTAEVARSFTLRSERWGFDPEITAKILKRGHRIVEVPIAYTGRDARAGKKITWRDGFRVALTLVRERFTA